MAGRRGERRLERADEGKLRPRKEGADAGVAARADRGHELGDGHGAGGGDGDARLGHDPLERLEAGAVAHVVRQQPVALLHRPLELPEQGAVARMEAGDEAIEEAPAVRRRSGEEAVHGGDEPDHLDVVGQRAGARPGLAVDAHDAAAVRSGRPSSSGASARPVPISIPPSGVLRRAATAQPAAPMRASSG